MAKSLCPSQSSHGNLDCHGARNTTETVSSARYCWSDAKDNHGPLWQPCWSLVEWCTLPCSTIALAFCQPLNCLSPWVREVASQTARRQTRLGGGSWRPGPPITTLRNLTGQELLSSDAKEKRVLRVIATVTQPLRTHILEFKSWLHCM